MSRDSDIVTDIQQRHKDLLIEQYNADPVMVDRQFTNIERDIRLRHGGSPSYVFQDSSRADRDAAIRDMRRSGMQIKAIAERVGLTSARVSVICKSS